MRLFKKRYKLREKKKRDKCKKKKEVQVAKKDRQVVKKDRQAEKGSGCLFWNLFQISAQGSPGPPGTWDGVPNMAGDDLQSFVHIIVISLLILCLNHSAYPPRSNDRHSK